MTKGCAGYSYYARTVKEYAQYNNGIELRLDNGEYSHLVRATGLFKVHRRQAPLTDGVFC